MVCPRGGSGVPDWSGFSAGCGYEAEGLEIPEPLAKRVLTRPGASVAAFRQPPTWTRARISGSALAVSRTSRAVRPRLPHGPQACKLKVLEPLRILSDSGSWSL